MIRKDDWDAALLAAIRHHASIPFAWGTSDCLTFPRDCVEAMTGVRLFDSVEYDSEVASARRMVELGFENIGDLIASVLPEIARLQVNRGDVVTLDHGGMETGGIVTTWGVAHKVQDGVSYAPLDQIKRAFKVG
jgi:hypothetical protein